MTCPFEIEGQQFLALSGGPQFSFHQAIDRARALPEMLQSRDAARTERVMRAMFEMKKLDIAKLRQAFGPNQEEGS